MNYSTTLTHLIEKYVRQIEDFPRPGVIFQDLIPLFAHAQGFSLIIDALSHIATDLGADLIAGIDARGFLLAGAVADRLSLGVLAIRKAGKLPPPVIQRHYQLEYDTATLEIPAIPLEITEKKVLIIDDVLATGGTAHAASELLKTIHANPIGIAVIIEITTIRPTHHQYLPIYSLYQISEHS